MKKTKKSVLKKALSKMGKAGVIKNKLKALPPMPPMAPAPMPPTPVAPAPMPQMPPMMGR